MEFGAICLLFQRVYALIEWEINEGLGFFGAIGVMIGGMNCCIELALFEMILFDRFNVAKAVNYGSFNY